MRTSAEPHQEYALLEQAYFHSGPPILVIDDKGCLCLCNGAASSLLGFDVNDPELTSLNLGSLFELSPPVLLEDIRAMEPDDRLIVRVRSVDQPEAASQQVLKVTRIEVSRQLHYALTFCSNKPPTRAFSQLNQQLKSANEQSARERVRSRELALEKEELVRFSTNAAHDLKTPLVQVRMLIECFVEDFGNDVPTDGLDMLRKASGSVDRLNAFIDRMLAEARSESTRRRRQTIDLDDAVRAVADSIEALFSDIGAQIDIVTPLGMIVANPVKFQQLIANMLSNAIKYRSPERPLTIELSTEQKEGRVVSLAIRDNGIGFDQSSATALFEPYNRLDNPMIEGHGIGLSTCFRICHAHRWTLEAYGSPGEGAEFRIGFIPPAKA